MLYKQFTKTHNLKVIMYDRYLILGLGFSFHAVENWILFIFEPNMDSDSKPAGLGLGLEFCKSI